MAHIVGGYNQTNSPFPAHGFLDVGGVFNPIDNPNATSGTEASNINVSDQIVGSYNFIDPAHPFEGVHGFLLSGGSFTAIDYPAVGVTSTSPSAINDFGDVVGVYRMNSPGTGFILSGGYLHLHHLSWRVLHARQRHQQFRADCGPIQDS